MVKLVDTLALGASGATRGGSSPLPGTIIFQVKDLRIFFSLILPFLLSTIPLVFSLVFLLF